MYQPVDTVEELQSEWKNQYVQWYAAGMPSFKALKRDVFKQIAIKFKSQEDRQHFSDRLDYNLTNKTNVVYYPARGREVNMAIAMSSKIRATTTDTPFTLSVKVGGKQDTLLEP